MKKIIVVGLLAVAAGANAQVLWDNTASFTGTTSRTAQNAPALNITNTNAFAVTLGSVAFSGENTAAQQFEFFLASSTGTILQSTFVSFGVLPAHSIISTNVNWTLAPGTQYFIGAISQTANANYDYRTGTGTLQNGLQGASANGNFTGYGANLAFGGTAGAEMAWRLSAPVPEPASMIVIGSGVAALVARRRKRA